MVWQKISTGRGESDVMYCIKIMDGDDVDRRKGGLCGDDFTEVVDKDCRAGDSVRLREGWCDDNAI